VPGLFLGLGLPGVFHLAPVEAHGRIVRGDTVSGQARLCRHIGKPHMIGPLGKAILAVTVATLWVALPGIASSKDDGATVLGSGQTTALDCDGGAVRVAGSNNKVTLTGACRRLTILGSRNAVTVTFGAGSSVWLVGASNEVTWTTPDGKEPKVHQIGSNNTLKRGEFSPPAKKGSDPFPL